MFLIGLEMFFLTLVSTQNTSWISNRTDHIYIWIQSASSHMEKFKKNGDNLSRCESLVLDAIFLKNKLVRPLPHHTSIRYYMATDRPCYKRPVTNHEIAWENSKIIATNPRYHQRRYLEAYGILIAPTPIESRWRWSITRNLHLVNRLCHHRSLRF